MPPINGVVKPGFETVRDAFAANFEQHGEAGAACSVFYKGELAVDIWGGMADRDANKSWQQDTIQLVFSAAKGMTTACILMLVEQGKLDLDAPIANYWPEFAANGKEGITTRMVMCHQAGLAAVDGDLTLQDIFDWFPVVNAIAAQAPNWPPGAAHGYHARSFGWILGEILRRITGVSIGKFLQQEIASPLGLDMWIGLPTEKLHRCAKVITPDSEGKSIADILGSTSLTARVMQGPSNLFEYNQMWNEPALLQAEMPSSNAVTDARSLAKFYAAMIGEVDGVRLLNPQIIEDACRVQSAGKDMVVLVDSRFGTGFALPPFLAPHAGAASFGHSGAGGSLGMADPEAGISFGYVMNKMRFDMNGDPRTGELLKAVYGCL